MHLEGKGENVVPTPPTNGDFYWEGGDTISKNSYKTYEIYEKLPCKGEPYGFSG